MGQRLQQITGFAAGRPLLVTGKLGELESRLEMAVQKVKPLEQRPRGRLILEAGDGQSFLELREEEISDVLPCEGGQSLLLLLDGGLEFVIRPQGLVRPNLKPGFRK